MLTVAILAVLCIAVFLLGTSLVGWMPTLLIMALLALATLPHTVGLVWGELPVGTYTLAVLGLAALALYLATRRTLDALYLPLGLFVIVGLLTFWQGTSLQWEGGAEILIFIAAWIAGRFLGHHFDRDSVAGKALAIFVLALVVFELVICVLQTAGVEIFTTGGRTEQLEGDRANGSFDHPGDLGKVLVLLMVLIIPLTRAKDAVTRIVSTVALVLTLVPIGLTQSRANFIVALGVVALRFLLLPPEGFGRRARLISVGAIVLIGVPFAPMIIQRFLNDPAGGERGHFVEVALSWIPRSPFIGIGPNSYIAVIGEEDRLTRFGWRVHNIFLLEAVELGIIGALLFFVPVAWILYTAFIKRNIRGPQGDFARAFIAVIPGFILIGITGWALVYSWIAELWFFLFAFAFSQMIRDDRQPTLPRRPGVAFVERLDQSLLRRISARLARRATNSEGAS